jgi:hypothetical protein
MSTLYYEEDGFDDRAERKRKSLTRRQLRELKKGEPTEDDELSPGAHTRDKDDRRARRRR